MDNKKLQFASKEDLVAFINSIKSGRNKDFSRAEVKETIILKKFNGDTNELMEEIVISDNMDNYSKGD